MQLAVCSTEGERTDILVLEQITAGPGEPAGLAGRLDGVKEQTGLRPLIEAYDQRSKRMTSSTGRLVTGPNLPSG